MKTLIIKKTKQIIKYNNNLNIKDSFKNFTRDDIAFYILTYFNKTFIKLECLKHAVLSMQNTVT